MRDAHHHHRSHRRRHSHHHFSRYYSSITSLTLSICTWRYCSSSFPRKGSHFISPPQPPAHISSGLPSKCYSGHLSWGNTPSLEDDFVSKTEGQVKCTRAPASSGASHRDSPSSPLIKIPVLVYSSSVDNLLKCRRSVR